MRCVCGFLIAFCWLALGLWAQVQAGGPSYPTRLLGEVRDLDGEPWVGAEVVIVHRSRIGSRDSADMEVIRERADERGRFRASIQPGRPHVLWAEGPGVGGARRISEVLQDVQSRQAVLLHERAPLAPRGVALHGFEPWEAFGPLLFQVIAEDLRPIYVVTVHQDATGRLSLPPMPGDRVRVEAFVEGGPCVARKELDQVRGDEPAPPVELSAAAVEHRLLYVGTGQRHAEHAELYVGTADADFWRPVLLPVFTSPGLVEFTIPRHDLPAPGETGWLTDLRVVVPGRADLVLRDQLWVAEQPLAERRRMGYIDGMAILRPTSVLRGVVTLDGLQPAADMQLCLYEKVPPRGVAGAGDAPPVGPAPRVFRTDAQGAFSIPGVRGAYRLTVLPGAAEEAFGDSRCPDCGEFVLRSGTVRGDADARLGTLSLSRLRFLEVEVTSRSGAPVDRPVVLVAELEEAGAGPFRPVEVHADTLGRTRVLVPADRDFVIAARGDRGLGYALVLADERRRGEANADPVVVFLDGPVVSGTVRDDAGAGLAGAKLWVDEIESTAEDEVQERVVTVLQTCFRHDRTYPVAVTDDRGAFSLRLPCADVRVWFRGRAKRDGAVYEVDGGWVYGGDGRDDVELTAQKSDGK